MVKYGQCWPLYNFLTGSGIFNVRIQHDMLKNIRSQLTEKYNLNLEYIKNYNNNDQDKDILNEIYKKKNEEKIKIIDKNVNNLISYIGRIPDASPATGYAKRHISQQQEIIKKVFN